MSRDYSTGLAYTSGAAYTPAATVIQKTGGILLDVDGTVTVKYYEGGDNHVIPLAGGVIHPLQVVVISAIGTAAAVHVFR